MASPTATRLKLVLGATPSKSPDDRAHVEIYRPFFLAGILSVLTAGCALGAIALLGIALQGSYIANTWTPYVLAHANSQLYGWVGFFVMGFALQNHAPSEGKKALFLSLAKWSLGLMAVGVGLRFAAEPLVAVQREVWLPIGVFSCLLQVVAIGLFMLNTTVTRYRTGEALTWPTKFVYTALLWWLAVAVAEPIYFVASHAPERMQGIMFVAEWFPPYREAQFLGFVAQMIFGVAFVRMHTCFGAKKASRTQGNLGFWLWNVGLAARMVGWLIYFRAGLVPGSGTVYFLGGLLLLIGGVVLVANTRMFEALEGSYRSHKFIRAAMGWLVFAGLLMLFEPIHLAAIGAPFSHEYTGAVRHAVTVGFISQMILGVGLHMVSRMNGVDETTANPLWTVWVLLNVGNALRVGLEIATSYTPVAFLPMGVTGFIELTALCIWAAAMVRPMILSRKLRYAR